MLACRISWPGCEADPRRCGAATWEPGRSRPAGCGWSYLEATIREHHNPANPEDWRHADRGMGWLFPDSQRPVLADWFTGAMESPRGYAQRTGQFSYGTPYTRVFHVEAGAIVGTELKDNRVALRAGIKKFDRFCKVLDNL